MSPFEFTNMPFPRETGTLLAEEADDGGTAAGEDGDGDEGEVGAGAGAGDEVVVERADGAAAEALGDPFANVR